MPAVYMATSDDESTDRRDVHVQWIDDADCYAVGVTSTGSGGRIYDFSDGSEGGGVEGSITDVGGL